MFDARPWAAASASRPGRRRAECVPDLGGQRAVLARGVGEADDELAQDDDGEQAEALGQVRALERDLQREDARAPRPLTSVPVRAHD